MGLLLKLTQKLAHGFLGFYNRYPRKEARKDAEKAWSKLQITPDTEEQIHKALDWQIPLWEDREKRFIPLPATYLRGERWTDEPPTPTRSRPTVTPPPKAETPMVVQQMDAAKRIRALMTTGMDRETATEQVSRELGWLRPEE